jgi:hypothetical protein
MMRSVHGPAGVVARLERAVQGGAASGLARFVQCVHFGVGLAGALVRALSHDNPVIGHHAGADDRIGRRPPKTAARLLERPPHPPCIVYHLSWKSAST